MGNLRLDNRGVIVACANCGQRNRTAYEHLGENGVCGKCKSALPAPSEPIDVDFAEHFDLLSRLSAVPVVVDFWAPWCAPCRQVAPEIAKVAANAQGRFVVAKACTQALRVGQRFGIELIPTMAVYHRGVELARTQGARPAKAIEVFVTAALAGGTAAAR